MKGRRKGGIVSIMDQKVNILKTWLEGKPISTRTSILSRISKRVVMDPDIPIESVIEHIAAGLLASCAIELGLTPVELKSLLRTPKEDALSGLVTVIHSD